MAGHLTTEEKEKIKYKISTRQNLTPKKIDERTNLRTIRSFWTRSALKKRGRKPPAMSMFLLSFKTFNCLKAIIEFENLSQTANGKGTA